VLLAVTAAGCGAVNRVTSGDPVEGKKLFISTCGGCHTLAAAGTKGSFISPGKVNPAGGPDLDDAFRADKSPLFRSAGTEQTIRDVVRGQIAYAESDPGTSKSGMPDNLLRGQQARDVAVYVAMCAAEPSCSPTASG
jgi:mono/diheme cytochrome c family protein